MIIVDKVMDIKSDFKILVNKISFLSEKRPRKVELIPEGARTKVLRHFDVLRCLLQEKQMSK